MSEYNHYEEAYQLMRMLCCEGLVDHANALQSVIDNGSTGTEIFMSLKFEIQKLLNTAVCSDITFKKAEHLSNKLDEALQ